LRSKLDRLVPQYAKARGIASQFFGGENALDAGAKAVNYKGNLGPLKQTLVRMSPAEREMFQESYADALATKFEGMPDRSDVTTRLFNSPQDRAKIDAVFGPQGTQTLEAFLRRENIFDAARKALGNSTTVRQMIEAGLAGGAIGGYFDGTRGALEGAGLGAFGFGHTAKFGAARALTRQAVGYVDRNVAKRVAELLTSSDPTQLAQGLKMAARNTKIAQGLRAIEDRITSAASARTIPPQAQQLAPVGTARNDTGGFTPVADDTGGFTPVPQFDPAEYARFKAGQVQRAAGGSIKLSHAAAGYHQGHGPKGSHCRVCRFYLKAIPPHCQLVADPIRPDDGCRKFERKENG
jgi:hypothetical protein